MSYHLSRPGSEIDPETLSNYRHGLMELRPALDTQLNGDSAVLEITPLQTSLLATALSSIASELKMYSVLDTMAGASRRPRSTAPGFDERLRTLFPEVAGDPDYASKLAGDIIMLRRDLPLGRAQEVIKEEREAAAARRARKRWWQFWRR